MRVMRLSLGSLEESVLGMNGWAIVGVAAASLGSASPHAQQMQVQLAQASGLEPAYPQAAPVMDPWYGYKLRLAALARQQGVSETTIQANVPGLTRNERVIELERTEPVARSTGGVVGALAPYLRAHVTGSVIRRGQANYSAYYGGLKAIDVRYGVDPAVLMAIWGMETSYGTVMGSTDLLQALASLGYYGRRRDFFENEFVATLKLMDQGVPRGRPKGSWPGAH